MSKLMELEALKLFGNGAGAFANDETRRLCKKAHREIMFLREFVRCVSDLYRDKKVNDHDFKLLVGQILLMQHGRKCIECNEETDRVDPFEEWKGACECAIARVRSGSFEEQGNLAIECAKYLLGLAHSLKGVACKACHGIGERAYGSTATWHGGIGGQMLTDGVCDKCWGTGRTDRTGPDQRKINNRLRGLK